MEEFEKKEIRGLNARSLFWLISCTTTIVFSIFTVYFSLKSQIETITIQKDSDAKYNELRMKTMEQKIDINSLQIKDLQTKTTK